MSARDQRAATAARFSSAAPPPDAERDEAPAPAADVGRRIRGTYDLLPVHYRRLGARCAEAADELGEVRVTRQDAVEALVRLVLTDESTARRWTAELRALARERR